MCFVFPKANIPLWAVWPFREILDAKGDNTWQRYNYFCIEPNFRGVPVLEIEPSPDTKIGEHLQEKKYISPLPQRGVWYRRSSSLPRALLFKEKTNGDSIPRGVVFLSNKPEMKTKTGDDVWNVGVDFGTTTTTAFYTINAGNVPQFIHLLTE
jgi:hypothetical protein